MAKYSEAQKKATIKYLAEHREQVRFWVKKGDKERYKAQAAAHGLSLTAYIVELLERDAKDGD